jgi:hypothetical protein
MDGAPMVSFNALVLAMGHTPRDERELARAARNVAVVLAGEPDLDGSMRDQMISWLRAVLGRRWHSAGRHPADIARDLDDFADDVRERLAHQRASDE